MIILFLSVGIGAKSQLRNDKVMTMPRMIRFYPNPATSFIQFDIPAQVGKESHLQIFNFLGKKVVDLPSSQIKTRVDVTSLTRGIYIFQLKDKSGKIMESGKFQIEK